MLIPIAVVARARELSAGGRDFSTVVRMLAIEGNGTWPRKTLLRRVRSTAAAAPRGRGQKVRARAPAGEQLEQLEDVAKTTAGDELSPAALELESMIAVEPYDTRLYHELMAALHAELGGPCGCYSCGYTRLRGAHARGERR